MTVKRSLTGEVLQLQCDTAMCLTTWVVSHDTRTRSALSVRTLAHRQGWSTASDTRAMRSSPHSVDYCADCTGRRAAGFSCPDCTGGTLFDLLGHTQQGHHAARALYRAGITTAPAVRRLGEEELTRVRGIGVRLASFIATQVLPEGSSTVPTGPAEDETLRDELREAVSPLQDWFFHHMDADGGSCDLEDADQELAALRDLAELCDRTASALRATLKQVEPV